MGARGALPKPADVHYLRGNPGKRVPKRPVKATPGIPNPPTYLNREAKAEWKRITPELDRLGILASIDRAILTLHCTSWAWWVEANFTLEGDGLLTTGEKKDTVKNPAAQLYRDMAATLMNTSKQLGLTPDARLRMTPPGKDDDGASDLLS